MLDQDSTLQNGTSTILHQRGHQIVGISGLREDLEHSTPTAASL